MTDNDNNLNNQKQETELTISESIDNQDLWLTIPQWVIKKWHPIWILLLIILTSISPFVHTLKDKGSQVCEPIEYAMLKDGMTLTEVRAIFQHRGQEISHRSNIAKYVWEINGNKITVEFENGKLVEKNQDLNCQE